MKAMTAMNLMKVSLVATALATGLAGCSMTPGPSASSSNLVDAVDGTRCGSSVVAGPVYIDVTYAADGSPINPGDCTVDSGTDVTWRGPDGEPVAFEIRFKTAAPMSAEDGRMLLSTEAGGRYKVKRKITGAQGRYDYGIKANGKVLDPAIIIRPN